MFKGSEWAPRLMEYLSGGRLVFVAGQVPDQSPLEPRPNFYNSKDQDSNQGNLPLYVLYSNEPLDLLKNHKWKYLPSKGVSRRCQYNMCSGRHAEVTILERSGEAVKSKINTTTEDFIAQGGWLAWSRVMNSACLVFTKRNSSQSTIVVQSWGVGNKMAE